MTVSPARYSALRVLGRVRRDGAFSGPVLNAELARANLDAADAALATRLSYGTLASVGVLDETIDRHLHRAPEPRIRDVLRLASFELLFGRAPAYAVADQAVELARAARPQAAGMVNAVVRRIAEDAGSFPWGDPETDLDARARVSAHPRWIVDLAIASLGPDAAKEMLACGLDPAPSYARLDPFAADRAHTLESLHTASPVSSPPDEDCYRLEHPAGAFGALGRLPGWFPMDAAAQMVPRAAGSGPGSAVCDVGAGRGNKTICLQAITVRRGGAARITAVDLHPGKVESLRSRLAASNVPGVTVVAADATDLERVFGADAFDTVLVDAPCSGLGTLRRYPEKRWRLTPADPARMSGLQAELLASAARVVRAGGTVVYSTCSVAREENQDVVDGFLSSEVGRTYTIELLDDLIPHEWERFRDGRGCFQSWPAASGPDGHFAAVLRRDRQ